MLVPWKSFDGLKEFYRLVLLETVANLALFSREREREEIPSPPPLVLCFYLLMNLAARSAL